MKNEIHEIKLKVIRWILFLPAAVLAFILTNTIFSAVWSFLAGIQKGESSFWAGLGWFLAGFVSTKLLIVIGRMVSPSEGRLAKWILFLPLIVISAFGVIGGVFCVVKDIYFVSKSVYFLIDPGII
jgi:hypothetical protein